MWGSGVSFFSIWCGQTAILYYGPTVFRQIGFTGQNAALRASGIFTCIKVGVTILFLIGGVQQFKRKNLLSTGSFLMAALLFALGGILKTYPPDPKHPKNDTPSGKGMVGLPITGTVKYTHDSRWQSSTSTLRLTLCLGVLWHGYMLESESLDSENCHR